MPHEKYEPDFSGEDCFINYYECPRCHEKWTDTWSCQADDDCPKCGFRHVSPYDSEDILNREDQENES
jgi:transcription initiation factor IIE alpha subunit